jgi:hypothetical protein
MVMMMWMIDERNRIFNDAVVNCLKVVLSRNLLRNSEKNLENLRIAVDLTGTPLEHKCGTSSVIQCKPFCCVGALCPSIFFCYVFQFGQNYHMKLPRCHHVKRNFLKVLFNVTVSSSKWNLEYSLKNHFPFKVTVLIFCRPFLRVRLGNQFLVQLSSPSLYFPL